MHAFAESGIVTPGMGKRLREPMTRAAERASILEWQERARRENANPTRADEEEQTCCTR